MSKVKTKSAKKNKVADKKITIAKKVGRPTIFTDVLVEKLLNRLTRGEMLEVICKDKDMPSVVTVFAWIKEKPEFSKGYSRARKRQAVILADKIKIMSDKGMQLAINCDETMAAAAKVNAIGNMLKIRVGSYQWLAAKYNKKFADHQNIKSKNENTNHNRDLSMPPIDQINRLLEMAKNRPDTTKKSVTVVTNSGSPYFDDTNK